MGQRNGEFLMDKVITKPKCRFCQASEEKQSIKGDYVYGGTPEQHFWECEQCRTIYLDPPMNEEDEARFYVQEFEKYMDNRAGNDMDWSGPENHVQSNQREVIRRMPFLEPYIEKGKKVLEVGCSSGFMLSALKERGMDVYGLDPSGGFIDFVRSKGISVFNQLDDLKKDHHEKFNLIIHYYVLEHIRNPVKFLNEYMQLLSDDGVMVFEVPCASDPLVELYKIETFDKFYWSVAHHWYFNKESLSKFLGKVDGTYELLPEQRYDISNHMVWMQDGKPGGLGKYNDVFGSELNELYKRQLKKNWLCDTIVAVLKRK